MFTTGGQRLVIRGTRSTVPVTVKDAEKLAAKGWRWSGHSHPGGRVVLNSSVGDREVLTRFSQQEYSVIVNSEGKVQLFDGVNDIDYNYVKSTRKTNKDK